jgi:hypothetical protein
MRFDFLAAAVFLAGASLTARAAGACLPIDPTIVTVTGTLETKVFPGPPNYTSISDGDTPEPVLMLVLPQPICILRHGAGGAREPVSAREIQIASYSPRQFEPYMKLSVTVSGTLFQSVAGHQHSPILMHALSVQPNV